MYQAASRPRNATARARSRWGCTRPPSADGVVSAAADSSRDNRDFGRASQPGLKVKSCWGNQVDGCISGTALLPVAAYRCATWKVCIRSLLLHVVSNESVKLLAACAILLLPKRRN